MSYVAQVHKTLFDRVWEKVDHNGPVPAHCPQLGPCWIWMGYCDPKGYGRLNIGRHVDGVYRDKLEYAHRLTWELTHGPVPAHLWVLHKCDNPQCVRPGHLFLGTVQDNNADRHAKGGYATQSKGEDHYKCGLTDAQVLEIRRICQPAKCGNTHKGPPPNGYTDLAKRYNVTYDAIRLIVLRKNRKNI